MMSIEKLAGESRVQIPKFQIKRQKPNFNYLHLLNKDARICTTNRSLMLSWIPCGSHGDNDDNDIDDLR